MRVVYRLLLCFWLFVAGSVVRAQEEEFPIPAVPESRVLDEARLFAREPQRLAVISETLAMLEAEHGYRFYVAIYNILIGRTLKDQTERLQEKWLGQQPGMVLVIEADSFKFRFGQLPPEEEKIEPGNMMVRSRPTDFAPIELERMIGEIEESLRAARTEKALDADAKVEVLSKGDGEFDASRAKPFDRQLFVENLSTGLVGRISDELDHRAAAPPGGTRSRMVVLAIGLLAFTGLLALLVVAGLKRAEARARERYVFPRVAVGMRLGAPYGGGKVSSRSFGRGN